VRGRKLQFFFSKSFLIAFLCFAMIDGAFYLLINFLEISLLVLDRIALHCSSSLCPANRTHFSMLVSILQSLYKTQSFIQITTHRCIINRDLTEYALWVNDEGAAKSKTIRQKHTVAGFQERFFMNIVYKDDDDASNLSH
jgi:hypothetical protein